MSSNIVYRLGTREDYDQVLQFLREHFYPFEPMRNSFEPRHQDRYDEEAIASLLANEPPTSYIALCNDQIVGALLATPKTPEREKRLLEEASRFPGTKWAIILVFMATLERGASVYKKYNVDKALHSRGMTVHAKFRGKGIAMKLGELSLKRAKELGYSLYTSDCMSSYSAIVREKLNFECVHEIVYADYRDPGSDKQIFFPSKEHPSVRTYAKRL